MQVIEGVIGLLYSHTAFFPFTTKGLGLAAFLIGLVCDLLDKLHCVLTVTWVQQKIEQKSTKNKSVCHNNQDEGYLVSCKLKGDAFHCLVHSNPKNISM